MQREGKKANGRNIWYESAEIEYLSTQLSSRRGTKKKTRATSDVGGKIRSLLIRGTIYKYFPL